MFALRSVAEYIASRRIVPNAISKFQFSYGDIQKILTFASPPAANVAKLPELLGKR
jgi:hypothetical protein